MEGKKILKKGRKDYIYLNAMLEHLLINFEKEKKSNDKYFKSLRTPVKLTVKNSITKCRIFKNFYNSNIFK